MITQITQIPSDSAKTGSGSCQEGTTPEELFEALAGKNIPTASSEEPDFRHQHPMDFPDQSRYKFILRMEQLLTEAEDRERQFDHRAKHLRTLLALLDKNPELLQILELLEEIQSPI